MLWSSRACAFQVWLSTQPGLLHWKERYRNLNKHKGLCMIATLQIERHVIVNTHVLPQAVGVTV